MRNGREGQIVQAIKQREASRENQFLVKKKPSVDTYLSILQAIKMGAVNPTLIVASSRVPWITVMQCVRKLEQKGLVETSFDTITEREVSRLTKAGKELLEEN